MSFDSSASAFFALVPTLTASQKTAVNQFVVGLKADNLWSKFDRLYINVGTTIAHYAICLVSLTSRIAVNAPTRNKNGTFYSGLSYFRGDVNVNAATQMTTTSASAGVFWDPTFDIGANGVALMGCSTGGNFMVIEFTLGVQ